MYALLKDLQIALRGLARRPAFTAIAVISLALGIGANGTVFSLVHGMLFRPLTGVTAEDELVRISTRSKSIAFPLGVSVPNFDDVRVATEELWVDAAGHVPVGLGVAVRGQPARVSFGLAVYGDYFGVLGTRPAHGRLFTGDDVAAFERVVVVRHEAWQRHFDADPDIIGQVVELNGQAFTVSGVTEEGFVGTEVLIVPDFWVPATSAESLVAPGFLQERGSLALRMTARMRPGVELATVAAALDTVGTHLAEAHPEENRGKTLMAMPESEARIEAGLGDASRMFGFVLLALVGGVLLIACANVASLVLARADGRRKELAVQVALGATRAQLVRGHLVDSLVVAFLGGLAGLAIAFPLARLIANFQLPTNLPIRLAAEVDLTVLLFMGGITLAAGLVFGVLPAVRAARTHPAGALRALPEAAPGRLHLGSVLVVAQVALSLVLLIAAGLFLRSLGQASDLDLGFEAAGIATITFDPATSGIDREQGNLLLERIEQRVAELPGVTGLTVASPLPMDWTASGFNLGLGRDLGEDLGDEMLVLGSRVGPKYFEVMKTPILAGRAFADTDDEEHPRVLIVNEALAQTVWPGADPIGRTLRIGGRSGEPAEVVGLVATGKYRIPGEAPRPYAFVPFDQDVRSRITLVIASQRPLVELIEGAQQEILALQPGLAFEDARPFEETVASRVVGPIGLVASLAGTFGFLGLVLAAVGLYGVMALQVMQRRREIGIRMALGAGAGQVLSSVVRRGLRLAAVGLVLGALGSLAATRVMGSFLLGVSPQDPLTFVAVILLLTAVAVLASLVPAVRAARIDPVRTLKAE